MLQGSLAEHRQATHIAMDTVASHLLGMRTMTWRVVLARQKEECESVRTGISFHIFKVL